jgi:hypothetical protein
MNKDLIQKFLNRSCWDGQAQYELEDWLNVEKFTELIVQECLEKIENEAAQYAEPVWAFELVNDIKEHFGVEE